MKQLFKLQQKGSKKMTTKDYIKIAQVLKTAREGTKDKQVIRHIITELNRVFKKDNPRFDENKFEKAIYEI